MEGSHPSRSFLEPAQTFQRQYEALRAVFVEAQPLDQVAERFSYKLSTLRSMVSRFRADCRRGRSPPFFSPTGVGDLPDRARARTDQAPNHPKSRTLGS
ncbi:MAG TPA: hypothetical protein VKP69_22075 [Isosphaeraceae bacterium]|nr:hypothetical protein [Isosphaeraceae bacterium]